MEFAFSATVFSWRGPAPYYFVAVPEDESLDIAELAPELSYGWGVVPVRAVIGETEWTTSLFPKDDGYLVPLKAMVRTAEGIAEGDQISVRLALGALS